jgi:hypothetical protein
MSKVKQHSFSCDFFVKWSNWEVRAYTDKSTEKLFKRFNDLISAIKNKKDYSKYMDGFKRCEVTFNCTIPKSENHFNKLFPEPKPYITRL